jgi:hypothetical protein
MPASKVTYYDSEGNRKTYIGDPRFAPKSYQGKTDPREKTKNKKIMQKFQLGKKYSIGGRANLLEEMGRIDAEKMNPNRRAEKHRVIGELNKGYKSGGRIGLKSGKIARGLKKIMERHTHEVPTGPHTDVKKRKINPSFRNPNVESGRSKEIKRKNSWKNIAKSMIGLKSGGAVLKGKKVGCQIK